MMKSNTETISASDRQQIFPLDPYPTFHPGMHEARIVQLHNARLLPGEDAMEQPPPRANQGLDYRDSNLHAGSCRVEKVPSPAH